MIQINKQCSDARSRGVSCTKNIVMWSRLRRPVLNVSGRRHITALTASVNSNTPKWKVVEVPMPTITPNDVIVKVHAAGVNPLDTMMSRGYGQKLFAGLGMDLNSVILGKEGAGTITQVGSRVWDWKVGDEVYFTPDILKPNGGSFAEFCSVPQFYLARKPESISLEESAGIPYPLLTAWKCIEHAKPGTSVCIFGAGGNVGWFVLNVLKNIKNCRLTAVCGERHVNKVYPIAQATYRYTNPSEMEELDKLKFDLVIDVSSVKDRNGELGVNLVRQGGSYVSSNARLIPSIDTKNSLLCGFGSGLTDLAAKKTKFFKDSGIHYNWALFHPDGQVLSQVGKWIDEGKVSANPVKVISPQEFADDFEKWEQYKDAKLVLKFEE